MSMSNTTKRVKEIRRNTRRKFSSEEKIRIVVAILLVGFIPTVVFTWVFELTPEGQKRDSEVDHSQLARSHTARRRASRIESGRLDRRIYIRGGGNNSRVQAR